MSDAAPALICSNPACRISTTKKCIEGLDQESCTFFGKAPPLDISETNAGGAATRPKKGVDAIELPSGDGLTIAAACSLVSRSDSRVLAFIGPNDAGKTSLMASIYELLQENRATPYIFGGSQTLFAFERACHDSRVASGGSQPRHARTPQGEVLFYDLRLCTADNLNGIQVAFSDRSGEQCMSAANEPVDASEFPELERADTITLLVDGHRLLKPESRFNVFPELLLAVQRFIEAGSFRFRPQLAVVLTKLDEIRAAENGGRAELDFTRFVVQVKTELGNAFCRVDPFSVAASPQNGTLARGHGVVELLSYWLAPMEAIRLPILECSEPPRLFHRLLVS